jgi:predicted Ser/Thr protein kinase
MQILRLDSLPVGSELHGYLVDRVLGSGAFGITYLVRHRHLDTLHVIKEYLPDCAMREHSRSTVSPKSSSDKDLFDWGLKSFYKEAQLLHQLSHPHIVKVTDLFEANGTAYFVMPYLRGYTLHVWMKNNPSPSQDELETIFVPLLEGLKYIHEKGLLHRDVKPENIYITDNSNPILIDFGSARMAVGQKSKALTQILTPHFAPIEQYASKGIYTPAMDLYGFAGCMYQAITGELPEEAPNRLVDDEQPRLVGSEYEKRYAGHFLQAIDKSLSVHAGDRHQDSFGLQKDLVGVGDVPLGGYKEQLQYDDGSEYLGEFKDGKPHGQGTHILANGDKYVGEYKDGKRHGQGTCTFLDGQKFVGEFKDGKRHGQGTTTWADNEKYVGEFKDDKRHGQGTHTWANGDKYVGEFKDDKPHGQGRHTWASGNIFVGEYKDGKSHGQGTLTHIPHPFSQHGGYFF